MAIEFRCTSCRQRLSVSRRKAGHEVACPACGSQLVVPQDSEVEFASESPVDVPESQTHGGEPVAESAPSAGRTPTFPETGATPPAAGLPLETASGFDAHETGGFEIRKPASDFEEMDLTPMVDVTFLLLIFFMITAAFSLTKTIPVPSPDPEQEGAAQSQTLEDLEKNSIMVEIDRQNAILVEEEPVGDPRQLADVLIDRRRQDDKHELILKADARALHETIVLVLDAAEEVQFTRIRLATLPEEID